MTPDPMDNPRAHAQHAVGHRHRARRNMQGRCWWCYCMFICGLYGEQGPRPIDWNSHRYWHNGRWQRMRSKLRAAGLLP